MFVTVMRMAVVGVLGSVATCLAATTGMFLYDRFAFSTATTAICFDGRG